MMVKMNTERYLQRYLGVAKGLIQSLQPTADWLGFHFPAGEVTSLSSTPVEGMEVKMGQLVKIRPLGNPETTPSRQKYMALISYNPKLAELGAVSCPPLAPAGQEISLTFKAYRNVNLEELEYLFTIYVTE